MPGERLVDGEPRHDLFAGRDVADLLGEQARAILVDDTGGVPVDDGFLEALSGALLLVYLADDSTVAHLELVAADGSVGGERDLIGDRERLGVSIDEPLLEHDPREPRAGVGRELGSDERQLAAVGGDQPAARSRCRGGLWGGNHRLGHGHHGKNLRFSPTNGGARALVTKKMVP